MHVELAEVELPDFGVPALRPEILADEYESRARALYDAAHLDWVAVYGDREHFANLCYFAGFDPRFEEGLLLLGPSNERVLIVGNEGVAYASLAGSRTRIVLCQAFSLLGQDRSVAPKLSRVLRDAGITADSTTGIVGWKYLTSAESDDDAPAFVPTLVVNALKEAAGRDPVDITALVLAPNGLRSVNSATQIAAFEWAATRASRAVQRIIAAARPGVSELQAVSHMGYEGEPLSAHVMFASGRDTIVGLRSPSTRDIEPGDGATTAVGYWGGLACRAGVIDDPGVGPFWNDLVKPYFRAIVVWHRTVGIGVPGGKVYDAVRGALAEATFSPFVNPGHQIGLDEWLNSPMQPKGSVIIQSGMMLQSDIIPTPVPPGQSVNCEDTLAVADERLRAELSAQYPAVWGRIQQRRTFLREKIGIALADEVLPLSNSPAYLAPFWLAPSMVCTVDVS